MVSRTKYPLCFRIFHELPASSFPVPRPGSRHLGGGRTEEGGKAGSPARTREDAGVGYLLCITSSSQAEWLPARSGVWQALQTQPLALLSPPPGRHGSAPGHPRGLWGPGDGAGHLPAQWSERNQPVFLLGLRPCLDPQLLLIIPLRTPLTVGAAHPVLHPGSGRYGSGGPG